MKTKTKFPHLVEKDSLSVTIYSELNGKYER
ncbi:MAG: hypothetical protein RIQ79_2428 [Verrucomicrobiota bacterium]